MKTIIIKPNMMVKEDHIKEIQSRIAEEIRRDGVCVIPNGFYYEVVDIDVPEDGGKKYFITTSGPVRDRLMLNGINSTYGMWPKENPHLDVASLYPKQLTFTESYKKETKLSPNEVMDIYMNNTHKSDEFYKLMEKRIKELKEKDMASSTFNKYTYCKDCGIRYNQHSYICSTCELTMERGRPNTCKPTNFTSKGYGGFTETVKYIDTDVAITTNLYKEMPNRTYASRIPKIKDVRFNGPATIVFWSDDTKTVVKAQDEDVDYEKGLAMAIAKKALGNKGNYFNEFKKWIPEDEETTEYEETDILGVEVREVEVAEDEEALGNNDNSDSGSVIDGL